MFGVWDAVCALLAGSKVAMLPLESITNGGDVLGRYLCDNKVTRTMLTPSLAELLVAAAAHTASVHAREALDAMGVVVLCGETPRVGLVDALLSSQPDERNQKYSKSRVVANLYSLSEAHDVALERNLGSAVQEGLRVKDSRYKSAGQTEDGTQRTVQRADLKSSKSPRGFRLGRF